MCQQQLGRQHVRKEACRGPAGETDITAETNSRCRRAWRGPHLEGGGRLVAIPRVH